MSRPNANADRRELTEHNGVLYVDGIAVITSETYVIDASDPRTKSNPQFAGKAVPSVLTLLLDDESPAYQCNHDMATNCTYVSRNPQSVTAHQRVHGKVAMKQLQKDLATKKAAASQRSANHAAASKAVAERRHEFVSQFRDENGVVDLSKLGKRVAIMLNARDEAEREFQFALRLFIKEVDRVAMRRIGTSANIDPAVLEAAQKWNTVKDLFK